MIHIIEYVVKISAPYLERLYITIPGCLNIVYVYMYLVLQNGDFNYQPYKGFTFVSFSLVKSKWHDHKFGAFFVFRSLFILFPTIQFRVYTSKLSNA